MFADIQLTENELKSFTKYGMMIVRLMARERGEMRRIHRAEATPSEKEI